MAFWCLDKRHGEWVILRWGPEKNPSRRYRVSELSLLVERRQDVTLSPRSEMKKSKDLVTLFLEVVVWLVCRRDKRVLQCIAKSGNR